MPVLLKNAHSIAFNVMDPTQTDSITVMGNGNKPVQIPEGWDIHVESVLAHPKLAVHRLPDQLTPDALAAVANQSANTPVSVGSITPDSSIKV